MKKITKETETCSECGRGTTSPEWENFCDVCGKNLGEWTSKYGYIRMRLFPKVYNYNTVETLELCGWKCCLEWIIENEEKIRNCGHLSLPAVNMSNVEEFFQVINS